MEVILLIIIAIAFAILLFVTKKSINNQQRLDQIESELAQLKSKIK